MKMHFKHSTSLPKIYEPNSTSFLFILVLFHNAKTNLSINDKSVDGVLGAMAAPQKFNLFVNVKLCSQLTALKAFDLFC